MKCDGIILLMILAFLLVSCRESPENCTLGPEINTTGFERLADDPDAPFRFPMDDVESRQDVPGVVFSARGMRKENRPMYHAAEDYYMPAGTAVYAMADGEVFYSGPAGGYGWLIIVHHPEWDIYSLYGHLSPSRWSIGESHVNRGDLMGYLGDDSENGGSETNPLKPHLHLGVRTGTPSDYPGNGQWRWMAGWIRFCPEDLGWIPPSTLFLGQSPPPPQERAALPGFFVRWGGDLFFGGMYTLACIGSILYAVRKRRLFPPLLATGILTAAALYLGRGHWRVSGYLYTLAAVMAAIVVWFYFRRAGKKTNTSRKR